MTKAGLFYLEINCLALRNFMRAVTVSATPVFIPFTFPFSIYSSSFNHYLSIISVTLSFSKYFSSIYVSTMSIKL